MHSITENSIWILAGLILFTIAFIVALVWRDRAMSAGDAEKKSDIEKSDNTVSVVNSNIKKS